MTSSTPNKARARLYAYGAVTLGCAAFSFGYEQFAHQVYSSFMVCSFAIPLVLGVLPSLAGVIWPRIGAGGPWQRLMHGFAIATLTVGSLLQGVLEIYGTSSQLIAPYLVTGFALLVMSVILWLIGRSKARDAPDYY